MAEHSKLPWTSNAGPDGDVSDLIDDASGSDIAMMLGFDEREREANAGFIVRAVNAHQDLVDALCSYVELEEAAAPYSSSPMRQRARAALAKAKGGDDA